MNDKNYIYSPLWRIYEIQIIHSITINNNLTYLSERFLKRKKKKKNSTSNVTSNVQLKIKTTNIWHYLKSTCITMSMMEMTHEW